MTADLRAGLYDWMCTYSGVKYYPAAPDAADVRIVDIAHHLARICRYTGAIKTEHYSVAEHSVHVSHCVPPHMAFMGLMHDAPEAYVSDINRPLKRSLPDYARIEALNWAVIAEKFGLPIELPREIHAADISVYLTERDALMPPMPGDTGYDQGERAPVKILSLAPNAAEYLFLQRYYDLTRFKDPLSRELHITLEGCAT
jgi:hypothetical protein